MSGAPRDAAPADRPMTVSALAAMIDGALRRGLPQRVQVVGEITGFSPRTHWYFRLADDQAPQGSEAVIDCVMFSSAARKVGFEPRNGQRVVLTGRIEFYPRQGRTQFYAERMEQVGAGDLDQRLKALLNEVRALGWLELERKRPLPLFPRTVAVVTSRAGAALQDVLDTMRRRCRAVDVLLLDVRVQGDGAAQQVAAALDWITRNHEDRRIDVVIVTRGGGSAEDLWAFNERIVAEAVVRCAVPVVAAIGHETDTTVAELVADTRAATPTQAAMRVTPDAAALTEQLDLASRRLRSALIRRIELAAAGVRTFARRRLFSQPASLLAIHADRARLLRKRLADALIAALRDHKLRLERLNGRLLCARPEAMYAARSARLRELERSLTRAVRRRIAEDLDPALESRLIAAGENALVARARRLDALERELIVTSPLRVLARGYSVTTTADGTIVRDAATVAPGTSILTRVASGQFRSTVDAVGAPDGAMPPVPAPPRRATAPVRRVRRPARGIDPDQPGLFGDRPAGD